MQNMQETWVRPLSGDDPLEEGMATVSSILAWEIPWTEEPGGLPSMGSQRVRHDRGDSGMAECARPWAGRLTDLAATPSVV